MVLERIYTIPLRKEFLKAPKYKRTKRAIKAIRDFIKRHMKCDNVKIGKYLNLDMWKHGRKNPPSRIQVKTVKDKKKVKDKEIEFVKVELINAPEEKKIEKKTKVAKKEEIKEEPLEKEEIEREDLEKEKAEVLKHAPVKKSRKEKLAIKDKTVKSQEIKEAMIIGDTGKK